MSNPISYPPYQYDIKPRTEAVVQCSERIEFKNGRAIVHRSWIGPDQDMLTSGYNLSEGSVYYATPVLSGVVRASTTTKMEDDRTKLEISVECQTSGGGGSHVYEDDEVLDVTWRETMAETTVPLYRYCSPSAAPNDQNWGNAAWLKSWEDETDATLKSEYKFSNGSSGELALSGKTLEIAKLMMAGIEERICFYPEATRVTKCKHYGQVKDNNLRAQLLNCMDQTPHEMFSWDSVSWLKTTWDWEENEDGTWILTESWRGSPKTTFGGWTTVLYGQLNTSGGWPMWPTSGSPL